MIKGLYDFIYGLGYRNGRYDKGQYNFTFYSSEEERDKARMLFEPKGEVIEFDFMPSDVIKREVEDASP